MSAASPCCFQETTQDLDKTQHECAIKHATQHTVNIAKPAKYEPLTVYNMHGFEAVKWLRMKMSCMTPPDDAPGT